MNIQRIMVAGAGTILLTSCSTANTVKQNTADLVYRGVAESQRGTCIQETHDKTPWVAAGAGGVINVATTRSMFKTCTEKAGGQFDEEASAAKLRQLYPPR
ncbi:MAG TPA: hypothetical protein VGT40_21315 [Methylomirabilota bacterium]|nr:hypothetical protein [Methylomirabilota bacterium]